jgi:predicted small lipoprotein YifL
MNRVLIAVVTAFAVLSLSACGTIGKGKGKAPPPEAAPVEAPITK